MSLPKEKKKEKERKKGRERGIVAVQIRDRFETLFVMLVYCNKWDSKRKCGSLTWILAGPCLPP